MLLCLISKLNLPGSFLSKSYYVFRIINIILLLQRGLFFCSDLYSPWNTLANTGNPVDFSWLVCSVLHPDARNPAVALLFSRPHLTLQHTSPGSSVPPDLSQLLRRQSVLITLICKVSFSPEGHYFRRYFHFFIHSPWTRRESGDLLYDWPAE